LRTARRGRRRLHAESMATKKCEKLAARHRRTVNTKPRLRQTPRFAKMAL
jgi:hypothetical protein